ncbi:MAG: glycosyltransferase 87 family protein, partial [Planctomycetota bacterium]|nr:glycosyltransferase 87 family protein [Planctomycetota bacterium]
LFYLLLVLHLHRHAGVTTLAGLLLIGVVMRLAMMPARPVLENDYFRYLWDGAVTAHGMSPYVYAPAQVQRALDGRPADADEFIPSSVVRLARKSGPVIWRIGAPEVTTIYPPVAQAVFALAHVISPWSFNAWVWVLLVFDALTLALLLIGLRMIQRPLAWSAIYWCNPLLVRELFSNGHMDVIVLPLVLAAVLLATRQWWLATAVVLALGVAVKVWPVLLAPLLFRSAWRQPRILAMAAGVFVTISAALWWPVFSARGGARTGFGIYAHHWENNDGAFRVVRWLCLGLAEIQKSLSLPGVVDAEVLARVIAAALVAAWALWLARRPAADARVLCDRALLTVAALFLLSPTGFPWYFTWLLPLLTLSPRTPLLLFTVLLPLYYLRFPLMDRPQTAPWARELGLLQHIPVLVAVAWASLRHRSERRQANTVGQQPASAVMQLPTTP